MISMTSSAKNEPWFWACTTNSAVPLFPSVEMQFTRLDPPEPIETNEQCLARCEAEKLTPPARVLKKMARKSTPSQQWWDEDFEGL